MKNANFLSGKVTFLGLVLALASTWSTNALANCWQDANLTELVRYQAQSGFPNSAARLPNVLVCANSIFSPGIGGDYTSTLHRIRIPVSRLNTPQLNTTIRHELGHSEVALTGQDDGLHGGHGPNWMRIMQAAGEAQEAQRVASYLGIPGPNPGTGTNTASFNGCRFDCITGNNSVPNGYGGASYGPTAQVFCRLEKVQIEGVDFYGQRVLGWQVRNNCWTQ